MADSIDVLVKLFDTLKFSSDKNEDATKQLISQQQDLVTYINNLPVKDLRDAIKEHSKDSKTNIDNCSNAVAVKTKDLMTEIKKVNSKVSKMILVVAVAFTILTGTYVVIRTVADDNSQLDKYKEFEDKAHNEILNNVTNQIKQLRRELFNKNNDEKNGG